MSSDYSIQAVKRLGKNKRKKAMEAMGAAGAAHATRPAAQANAVATKQTQAARPNDSVQLSSEIKGVEKTGSKNIESLKRGILDIKNQANASSATQKTEGVNAINTERNGLQAAKPETARMGMEPGMQNGSVMGVNGIKSGMEPGMKNGAVFSSRRTESTKKPAGEGLAAAKKVDKPKMDPTGIKKTTPGQSPQQANAIKPDHKVNELNKSQEVSKTRNVMP